LGFTSGPNSRQLLLQNIWWINPRSQVVLTFTQLQKGFEPEAYQDDGYDFGNNANENYATSNPEIYEENTGWLIGDIHTNNHLQLNYYYQLSNVISCDFGMRYTSKDEGEETTLLLQFNLDY
jgi:hypothetical protein